MSWRRKRGRRRKRRRNYKREYEISKRSDKQPVGAQSGSQNGLSHGIVAFKNEIKHRARRGRSLIDRRGAAGRNAFAMREELIMDMGGAESLSVAKLALVEIIARDTYFLDESERRIFQLIHKVSVQERALESLGKPKSPKLIATLYGYRRSVANNLVGEPYYYCQRQREGRSWKP